jgi:hypothetical protein
MEKPPVTLLVLYGEHGRIVSLSRVRTHDDTRRTPPMRSGVEPGKGQRVALIALDAAFDGWLLKDIHEQFSISEEDGLPRLVRRQEPTPAK